MLPPYLIFNPETGSIAASSDNKMLSGTSESYEVTCLSPDSNQANGIQRKTVTITFRDECYDAVLTPSVITPNYYEMDLYTIAQFEYSQCTVSLNCPVYYEFVPRPLEKPTPLSFGADIGVIDSVPIDYTDHMGQHFYQVMACVQVGEELVNCKFSEESSVFVKDPCVNTLPVSQTFTNSMQAARLTTD